MARPRAALRPPRKHSNRAASGRGARSPHAKLLAQNPFFALLTTVKREMEPRLAGFLAPRIELARSQGPEVVELVTAVRDLCLRGGKRFRPALLVAGFRSANARGALDPALDAGVALELLQAYLLIHDDWMDGDRVRRGGPAVHALLAKRFRSEHKGAAAGVLAGDYAAAVALEALSQLELPARTAQAAFGCFAQMQLDAIAGQQLDLVGKSYDVELAYQLKTGSYTVRGPLCLGAILGQAKPATLRALERFALPLGVAFQLRDDLLSAFGDPKDTGKPFGNDLRSGKRTVLLMQGLQRARGRELALLKRVAGNARARQAELASALEVLETSGARAYVEARVDTLLEQANAELTRAITPEGVALLAGAAQALTTRRS